MHKEAQRCISLFKSLPLMGITTAAKNQWEPIPYPFHIYTVTHSYQSFSLFHKPSPQIALLHRHSMLTRSLTTLFNYFSVLLDWYLNSSTSPLSLTFSNNFMKNSKLRRKTKMSRKRNILENASQHHQHH